MKITVHHHHHFDPEVVIALEMIAMSLQDVKDQLNRLSADVAAQSTVISSGETLLNGLTTQIKSLSDQIAALQAGTVTQADLDALKDQASGLADSVEAKTAEFAANIAANTPAAAPSAAPASSDTPATGDAGNAPAQ